jgi:hypothetical protein
LWLIVFHNFSFFGSIFFFSTLFLRLKKRYSLIQFIFFFIASASFFVLYVPFSFPHSELMTLWYVGLPWLQCGFHPLKSSLRATILMTVCQKLLNWVTAVQCVHHKINYKVEERQAIVIILFCFPQFTKPNIFILLNISKAAFCYFHSKGKLINIVFPKKCSFSLN